MASNAAGTPQSQLYAQRPVNTTRDRSMEQNNTNSGNPYGYPPSGYASQQPNGYAPQYSNYYGGQQQNLNRYAPPQGYGNYQPMNFQNGPYAYNSPNNYGQGTAPSGLSYAPQYQAPPGMQQGSNTGFNMGQPQYNQFQPQYAQQQAQQNYYTQAALAAQMNPQYNPQYTNSGGPQPAAPLGGRAGQSARCFRRRVRRSARHIDQDRALSGDGGQLGDHAGDRRRVRPCRDQGLRHRHDRHDGR